ncbi:MAG TPA: protein kinase [Blastocatellia bacterium]|nr:protein kinase [Blastocatellia bacterium]
MTITTGTRFGHYEVTTFLGKGGMGEVCLAEDTRLSRKVALKLLPSEFTMDSERLRRFELEARAASGLNHPNIITIYDIGVQYDTHYIATEYIAGETLRARLQRPISLDETLSITLQVAHALAAAHEAGIIHRDIKPENVMIRQDGIVKVLDFGLAKLMETRKAESGAQKEEAETLLQGEPNNPQSAISNPQSTAPGIVMGTASYMSPEQARGEKVDERTDIFSLSVVLYEMLAGKRPFEGVNMIDVLGAILHQEPAPLPLQNKEAQRILTKALQKDRAARYQTAQAFAHDLQEWKDELAYQARAAKETDTFPPGAHAAPVPVSVAEPSITAQPSSSSESTSQVLARQPRALPARGVALLVVAILAIVAAVAAFFYFKRQPVLTDKDTILLADFTNTTGDAVFDGTLKQALAVHLAQSPFLNLFADERVRESLRLMNKSPDERITPTIGREICQRQSLKAMLTGSIASLGRNYVLNLEAVNGQTGDVLAREQAEAEGKEQVLRTLGEAATRLREKLGESLSSIQKFDAPLEQATTSSLEAFKAFNQGLEHNYKGKALEAISSLKHAIELDPNFARAYSALAVNANSVRQRELAAEAAQKAFELRARVSERERFHLDSSYYRLVTGELHKAIEALELCRQTYPRDATSLHNLAEAYRDIGQFEKAVEAYRASLRIEPDVGITLRQLAAVLFRVNRFEEAKAIAEQAITQKFAGTGPYSILFQIAFIQEDTSAMMKQVDLVKARPGGNAETLRWQADTAMFAGQWRKARELSSRADELTQSPNAQRAGQQPVPAFIGLAPLLGNCQQVRADLSGAIAPPASPGAFFTRSMALALCGETARVQALLDEAVKRYPKNTIVNEINLPLIRAALELQRGNRTQAIQILQAASRYESVSNFYQNYLRGQAYLGERNGAAAAREFQTILDHRGWSPTSPLYPLAHLGLARAAMVQSDTAKAQKSYQDFFALWKDADADVPVLMEAKKEYEKVK